MSTNNKPSSLPFRPRGIAAETFYFWMMRFLIAIPFSFVTAIVIGLIANAAPTPAQRDQINIGFFLFLYLAFACLLASFSCLWLTTQKSKMERAGNYSTFAMTSFALDIYDARTKRLLRTKDEPPFASKSEYKERLKAVRARK